MPTLLPRWILHPISQHRVITKEELISLRHKPFKVTLQTINTVQPVLQRRLYHSQNMAPCSTGILCIHEGNSSPMSPSAHTSKRCLNFWGGFGEPKKGVPISQMSCLKKWRLSLFQFSHFVWSATKWWVPHRVIHFHTIFWLLHQSQFILCWFMSFDWYSTLRTYTQNCGYIFFLLVGPVRYNIDYYRRHYVLYIDSMLCLSFSHMSISSIQHAADTIRVAEAIGYSIFFKYIDDGVAIEKLLRVPFGNIGPVKAELERSGIRAN